MKTVFCTISTSSHLYKVDTLFEFFLREYGTNSDRICWCIENDCAPLENGVIFQCNNFSDDVRIKKVFELYTNSNDRIRWALKPLLILQLLNNYDKVIYLDNDTFFFNSSEFLWDELDRNDVLLTPHNYPRDPKKNQNWLEANFKVGLYNAGFIGVNRNAKYIMDWWADCCLYRCEKSLIRGLFDDQKYLDLIPVMHPNTKIIEHKGCNVAGWNTEVCKRIEQPDGSVLIDNKWPIVFIHFNGFTNRAIVNGEDPLLKPYFDKYVSALQSLDPSLKPEDLWKEDTRWDRFKLAAWKFLDKLNK